MCEIFGTSLKTEYKHNDILKTFYKRSDKHPHGWGLALFDGDEVVSIEKEPIQASKSVYLKSRLSHPILTKNCLAHIRYATIGNVEYHNCHPYTKKDGSGRRWTMIHNGTIFDYPPLSRFTKQQKGDTDSERILLYIIDRINHGQRNLGRPLNAGERFTVLDKIVCEMSPNNKLNLLIYDGEYMYAHTNYRGSLHYLETENGLTFSTMPLDESGWKPVPFTTLLGCKNGEVVFKGTRHMGEYEDNEESLKFLYQIFADL